ncbi:hypothetical protein [Tateyamaria sp.]|uniref:hypothetical protein n=1 Tax=Tateyamaria sp. TaxID=1929288 RepID=UPI0039B8E213
MATATICASAAQADGHVDRTRWPDSFTVGIASQGGIYFACGSDWATLLDGQLGISGSGEVTVGPMQNMALVHSGEAQFDMTTMGPVSCKRSLRHPPMHKSRSRVWTRKTATLQR